MATTPHPILALADAPLPTGRLAENIMHFGRTLRAAGLPAGPGKVLAAIRAVETVGVRRRDDFYWALHAVFVNRRDQQDLFNQAFEIFWRNPQILERMMGLLLPDVQPNAGRDPDDANALSRRLAEALRAGNAGGEEARTERAEDEVEIDSVLTYSDREVLRHMDFEQMSTAEMAQAKAAIAAMQLPIMTLPTRRFRPAPAGSRADLRATMRAALRSGGDIIPLRFSRPRLRPPPLVVLCDISGSMSRYSRMFLHFMHAVTNDRDRVHTFVFGTRLTDITRQLRHRDVDVALARVSEAVEDWDGGTRIAPCLAEFNLRWARRVLGQGAVVLFVSDGLEREGGETLGAEVERLRRSCRRLIWLNPLLRYAEFEPKSAGIRAILPHVDDFRAVHNLESLDDLAAALAALDARGSPARTPWRSVS